MRYPHRTAVERIYQVMYDILAALPAAN